MKRYIKILENNSVYIDYNNETLKKGDIIILDDSYNTYLNNKLLKYRLFSFNTLVFHKGGFQHNIINLTAQPYDCSQSNINKHVYFILYNDQYLRDQKLNTLLDENIY